MARSSRSGGPAARGATTKAVELDVRSPEILELLVQGLETEIGGVQVYKTAIQCAENGELRDEWQKYLEETQNHERILRNIFDELDLDPELETPGREAVRTNGEALVRAMQGALDSGNKGVAQVVAAECVVLAETKDHLNWELVGEVVKHLDGPAKKILKEAYDEIEEQEDEHLFHTRGWARELWFESMGIPAVLPPPEEKKDVRSEIGAARAKQARKQFRPRVRAQRTSARGRRKRAVASR